MVVNHDRIRQYLYSPTLTFTKNLPYLAGKKLTLSFTPASQADLDLINSYLPKPHADGTPIQPSELPASLPGYLIHLKAEIRVDGQVAAQGGSYIMGQELTSGMGLNAPGRGWDDSEDNHPIAGEYQAIGLDMQGVAASQLAELKTKFEQTKAKLLQYQANPTDLTPIQNLTKEDLSGDMLYSGILGYFASVDGNDQLAARAGKQVVSYRLPSYGIFMAAAQPHYWFGIARNVSFPGVVMDVDRVAYHVEATDADSQKRIAYMRQVGSAVSAFEHAVPERLFADPTKPLTDPSQPQGISAVKALAIAGALGQKIYTMNQTNQALHSTLLAQITIDPDARAEIQNALAAGKEVTVHASPITQDGWTGSGYTVLDPDTGAGAYKISGGANGSAMPLCNSIILAIQILVITVLLIALLAVLIGGLPALVATASVAGEIIAASASYITGAVAALPAAIRGVVAASLMVSVSSQVIAGDIVEVCQFQFLSQGRCWYLCQGNYGFDVPQPRDWCGNPTSCPSIMRRQ